MLRVPRPLLVAVRRSAPDLRTSIEEVLDDIGVLPQIAAHTRIAVKPNLTWSSPRPGVTTTPAALRAIVAVLRERTPHVAIIEGDGGYGSWPAPTAFAGHGLAALAAEYGVELVNLSEGPSENIAFWSRGRTAKIPLPTRLLHETDFLLNVPVPKVHAMTGVSLAYKNLWGCIPDARRLRYHAIFDEAIVAINRALRPYVLVDGTTFLDENGPIEGTPVPMNLVIGATSSGVADRYLVELMGIDWKTIPHLRWAAAAGDLPTSREDIRVTGSPLDLPTRRFRRQRKSLRQWIAFAGFQSRGLTWLGYESWFGRVIIHGLLYALAGRPLYEPARTNKRKRQ